MSLPSALSTGLLRQSELAAADVVTSLAISSVAENLAFLQRVFDDSNWKLHTAHSYKEAMNYLTREQLPIVICASQLPDGNWKDVLCLASTLQRARFIVTARHVDDRLRAEVLSAGAFDLLKTPFCELEVGYAIGSAWLDWKNAGQMQTGATAAAKSCAPIVEETILVMDDDASNRTVISAVLTFEGYHVLQAATGREAIDIANNPETTINVLVADVDLPDISGTEVAAKLIELRPDSKVLFISGTPVTAWTTPELTAVNGLPIDSVKILEKPFTPSTLGAKVRGLLDRHSRSKPQALAYL
jgi:DNA-binding response OmpR family regulator